MISNYFISKKERCKPLVCTVPFWRSGWDSNPRALAGYLISSQARYDHFDTAPYMLNSILEYNAIFNFLPNGEARYVLLRCPKFFNTAV